MQDSRLEQQSRGCTVAQRRHRSTILTGAITAMALALVGLPAKAQEFDFTMAVLSGPGDAYSKLTSAVPDRIAKATGGRVKVTVSDSLVPGPQIVAAVRDGRVQMSGGLHTYLAAEEPRMGIFNLPGLIDGMVEYKFIGDAFWFEETAKIWSERYNSIVLAEGGWCTQQLFSKEPIRKVEDFKNKRVRVHNPQTAELMNALGAKPVPLATHEIMPALERGIIDGLFTSTCFGHGQEYWRVAKNVQNWTLGPITGWAILVNKDAWTKLPADLQEKMRAAMAKLQHEALSGYHDFVRSAMEDMKKQGVEFWIAPDSERNRLFDPKYVKPAYDSWYKRAKEVGFDGEAYVEKIRKTLGKDLF